MLKRKTNDNVIKYFSCVTNANIEMMAAIFGRKNLLWENATLQGYELCVQTIDEISNEVPATSPLGISPREIIKKCFGPKFDLYIFRPNPNSTLRGKIWYVSPEEYEYLREWEMIEYGMQNDLEGVAINDLGDPITVTIQGLSKSTDKVSKVVDINHGTFIAPKQAMLKNARRVRKEYIERMKKKS